MYSLLENISEQRLANIIAGADEIQARFKDLLRNGLLKFAQNIDSQTDLLKRRLIDCQAPGLASMVSALTKIDYTSDIWKDVFVSSLSQIYMTASALKNIQQLDTQWQNELLVLAGVSYPQHQVFECSPVTDVWLVLAVTTEPFNSMILKRTWLYGQNSKRFAVYVQYFMDKSRDDFEVQIGSSLHSSLYFYEGIHSMRVLFKSFYVTNSAFAPQAYSGIDFALKIYRKALTDNPFMQVIPLILCDVQLAKKDGKFYLADSNNSAFPLMLNDVQKLNLLTYTCGRSFSCFVLLNQFYFKILSVWADNLYYFLDYEINRKNN